MGPAPPGESTLAHGQSDVDLLRDHARTANSIPTLFMELKRVFMSDLTIRDIEWVVQHGKYRSPQRLILS